MGKPTVWTEALDAKLRELWNSGMTSARIGQELSLSKNAIVGRKNRLFLEGRPSPIKRKAAADPALPAPAPASTLPPLASLGSDPPSVPAIEVPPPPHSPTEGARRTDRVATGDTTHMPASAPPVGSPAPERCEPPPLRPVTPLGRGLPAPVMPPMVVRPLPPPEPPSTVFKPRLPGCCTMPMWGHNERTRFGADGEPLLCGAPATDGPYCDEHGKVAFVKVKPRARATA